MAEVNYYEWLDVATTSDTDEIVQVLDNRYTALRALATHPDPAKVRQAEMDREIVEQARAVLTDPARRQAYDLALAGAAAGGLADPTAIPTPQAVPLPVPPRPKAPSSPIVGAGPAGGQACPKCGTVNDASSNHCLKCGTALTKSCPSCHHSVPHQAVHCPNCGVNMADFVRQQAEAEQERIEAAHRQVEIQARLGPLQQKANSASTWTKVGCISGLFLYIVGGMPFWLIALRRANEVLQSSRLAGDDAVRSKASNARTWSRIGLILGGIILLGLLISLLLSLVSY